MFDNLLLKKRHNIVAILYDGTGSSLTSRDTHVKTHIETNFGECGVAKSWRLVDLF